ncbi:MAG TPA: phosphoribosylformylglycinamidine synthase, partial [Comamonas sp.]
MTLHLTQFEGGNALSSFRAQQLLTDLVAIHPKITGISARFVHLVATEAPPSAEQSARLAALLAYGDPYEGASEGVALVVTPRMGTISPWASKATDIARNCGLEVFRVERITEYRIQLKSGLLGGTPELGTEQTAQIAALLHDRMTESVFASRAEAEKLFTTLAAQPMEFVDVLGGGRAALETANKQWG